MLLLPIRDSVMLLKQVTFLVAAAGYDTALVSGRKQPQNCLSGGFHRPCKPSSYDLDYISQALRDET
jgi:hypothetical protein